MTGPSSTHLQEGPHPTQNEEPDSSPAQVVTELPKSSLLTWKDALKEAITTTMYCLGYLKTLGALPTKISELGSIYRVILTSKEK